MTTLQGAELFEYLTHLETEFQKRNSELDNGNLKGLMHKQMIQIIESEKRFLEYINQNGTEPILSISPNGLPSAASLNPDLETICELSEEPDFQDITQKYKKGVNKDNENNKHIYVSVSEDEWNKELQNHQQEELQPQIGFVISETEDGKFELALKQDFYLKGYDKYSKEVPVLSREGTLKSHVIWNRLIDESKENFFIPNTALVLNGKEQVEGPKKVFDDIKIEYKLKKSDYEKQPFFLRPKSNSFHYANFLAAGTNTRVKITKNILEILKQNLGKIVSLEGVKNLEQVLAFSEIPFKNAQSKILKEEELYENDSDYEPHEYYKKGKPKFKTEFKLISKNEEIGRIEYILPYLKMKCKVEYLSCCYTEIKGYRGFNKGRIALHILGSIDCNENQYKQLQKQLPKAKRIYYHGGIC